MTRQPLVAEPGRVYPAWRDGRRLTANGPTLHAVTERRSGHTHASGWLALCGRPVRFKVEDVFDVDDDNACIECAAAVIVAGA